MAKLRKIKGHYYARIRYNSRKEKAIPLKCRDIKTASIRLGIVNDNEELIRFGEDVSFAWLNGDFTKLIELKIKDAVEKYLKYKHTDGTRIKTIE